MKNRSLKNLVLSAMFLAIGFVLPFFTGQIPAVGKMLLPMHIPVLLCGLICGWQWGLGVGFILPLLRSLLFSMPAMYPTAAAMAFEMAAYGAVIGFLYARSKWQCVKALYKCLIPAMLAGRQHLHLRGVPGRCNSERRARHRAAAGADPRRDGAAGSHKAGMLRAP